MALLVGTEQVVRETLAQPGVSSYHLGGFLCIDDEIKAIFIRIAGSAFVSDAALAALVEDDRLVRQYETLQRELSDELSYVSSLPFELWEFLGGLCGKTGSEVRHTCVSASHKQA